MRKVIDHPHPTRHLRSASVKGEGVLRVPSPLAGEG
ncbi:protein of unknown function [Nitrospina watsonii]|uniref:Uncharacterized protein n=1 Tax=Nitrospina watsonii TaxID=1323948 RepID=A0ABM9HHD5_9BACT|nr:protein of unknown function [Nitrospina watsonii]